MLSVKAYCDKYDYLYALNKRYYVNEESLHCTNGELQDIQELLLQDGLIAPSMTPCDLRP